MTTARKHKHAYLMQQWLDDDSLVIETNTADGKWITVQDPYFVENGEYRVKPKTIKCGDMEFPEPMRVAPALDNAVWLATIVGAEPICWSNNPVKQRWLKLGIIHATKAAAEQHSRALIALTGVWE